MIMLSHVDGKALSYKHSIFNHYKHSIFQLETLFGNKGDSKVSCFSPKNGGLLGLAGHHGQDIKSHYIMSAQYSQMLLSAVCSPILPTLLATGVPQPSSTVSPPCLVGP